MQTKTRHNFIDVDLYGIVLVAAISCLFFFFAIRPMNAKRQTTLQEQQLCQQNIDASQDKLQNLEDIVKRQKKLSISLASTKDVLLDNTGIDDVIQKIVGLAQTNSLILEDIIPQDEKVHEQFRTHTLSVSLQGLFPQFSSFLTDLGNHAPYIRVDEFNMAVLKNRDDGQCKINLNLVVFSPGQNL